MKQVFAIFPGSAVSLWVVGGIGVGLLVLLGLLGWTAYSSRHTRFEWSESGLRIRGDIYGRLVPRSDLLPEKAAIIDLDRDLDHRPALRVNGIGLPGYKSGWFRLRNGEKALAFLTRRNRVVYLPTSQGYCLLLSPASPEELIDAMRRGA